MTYVKFYPPFLLVMAVAILFITPVSAEKEDNTKSILKQLLEAHDIASGAAFERLRQEEAEKTRQYLEREAEAQKLREQNYPPEFKKEQAQMNTNAYKNWSDSTKAVIVARINNSPDLDALQKKSEELYDVCKKSGACK